jgi:hypothetical protein
MSRVNDEKVKVGAGVLFLSTALKMLGNLVKVTAITVIILGSTGFVMMHCWNSFFVNALGMNEISFYDALGLCGFMILTRVFFTSKQKEF